MLVVSEAGTPCNISLLSFGVSTLRLAGMTVTWAYGQNEGNHLLEL